MTATARRLDSACAPHPEALLRAGAAAALLVGVAAGGLHLLFGLDPELAAGLLPPCPFRAATGLLCPGCGLTRATLQLASLHPHEALRLHPLAPAAPALLAALALRPGLTRAVRGRAAALGLALVLAFWAARLLLP